jgi:pyruvate dehydrogenase phosphatase
LAGSCAIAVYVEDKDVYVACTGDSRAVICRDQNYLKNGQETFLSVPLSVDQTSLNPKEYARILEEHPGEESTAIVRGRILGGLMPTRAFGDARYKWSSSILATVLPHVYSNGQRGIPRNYKTPPYVTAVPEVVHYKRDAQDKFLVVATDGLWDELDSDTVVQYTGTLKGDENRATMLIKRAYGGNKLDRERIDHILSIPSPQSRRYRDDVSVHVIEFLSDVDSRELGELESVGMENSEKVAQLPRWLAVLRNRFQAKL